ncbi:MAG: hypothetical protein RI513_03970 [Balneolaceae bacterium]|nr:hypothetical protein [Balneolaceae bacterium]
MEVFEIIGLLVAGAAGLINYIQNRRRRELAEDLPEEGDEEFFPDPEGMLMETDEALEPIGQDTAEQEVFGQEAFEQAAGRNGTNAQEFGRSMAERTQDASPYELPANQPANQRSGTPTDTSFDESAKSRQPQGRESLSETDSSMLSPFMTSESKKRSFTRLVTKERARQAIVDAEVFAPPISKRKKGPFTPLSRPV